VSADAIRRRLAALREAGFVLRRRPAVETIAVLARVLDEWSNPESRWRRALNAELPAATGFSDAVVREGAQLGFGAFSGTALHELVERELGGAECLDSASSPMAAPPETTAVVLAGQVPMPTLLSILMPLALRSPVLARSGSRDPVTAALVSASLSEIDPEIGACLDVVSFPSSDTAQLDALLAADCVVATGSDEATAAIAARVRPPRRVLLHGHRLSVAALGSGATRDGELERAARELALDISLWDQLGCLSPIAVYVADLDDRATDRVARALAAALASSEARLPRGCIDSEASATIAHERAAAEMRAAAGRNVMVHASAGSAWTVVREDVSTPLPAPLHRFVRVQPVADANAVIEALHPLGSHLAGVAVAGFAAETPGLVRALAEAGASRVCAPGELQAPPLSWRREGRGVLTPLVHSGGLETHLPRRAEQP
jgi:hypothetical protein